jgi:serine protease
VTTNIAIASRAAVIAGARRPPVLALLGCCLLSLLAATAARAADYVPGEVVVAYASQPAVAVARVATTMGAFQPADSQAPTVRILRLRRGESVWQAIARLRRTRGVLYAVPDYLARVTDLPPATNGADTPSSQGAPTSGPVPPPGTPYWIPNDPGRGHTPQGWEAMQWNFLAGAGVDAPRAWANLLAVHRAGARGVVVAVLDTGVAYRNWRRFRKSPDFGWTHFVHPYDFVAHNAYPLDREGHGTFVAGMIAESTNNGYGLTGLAYNASIMPVRVLNANGWGDAETIARGIRYAVTHGAQVINLSLEFDPSVTAGDIPNIISALRFAHRHRVTVVAVSGNEGTQEIAYPARAPTVISVGATTKDRCLAEYSNGGHRLDLVAPGGGDDANLSGDPDCHPTRQLPNIYQMTFFSPAHPARFGYPNDWFGTSMAAPAVAAGAAMVIASGVLGRHPTPEEILHRLEQTAQPLGGSVPNPYYGYGLLDIGAATAPSR